MLDALSDTRVVLVNGARQAGKSTLVRVVSEAGPRPTVSFDAAFAAGPDLRHASLLRRREYAERLVRGGCPEAVRRDEPARRERFLDS